MPSFNFKSFLSSPEAKKNLLAILVLTLLISILPLLITAVKWRQEIRQEAAVGDLDDTATLELRSSATQIDVNDTLTVDVILDTGGQNVYAADIILDFNLNTRVLELTSIIPNTSTNFETFVPWVSGTEDFDEQGVINKANETGIIEFGAVVYDTQEDDDPGYDPYEDPVNDDNILIATLGFKGATTGDCPIRFQFDPAEPDNTLDTNVVSVIRPDTVDDILGAVVDTEITVGQPSECPWKICGDADCDCMSNSALDYCVDMNDFGIFRDEFKGIDVEGADANFDGSAPDPEHGNPLGVTMNDFGLFREGFRCEGDCSNAPHCL